MSGKRGKHPRYYCYHQPYQYQRSGINDSGITISDSVGVIKDNGIINDNRIISNRKITKDNEITIDGGRILNIKRSHNDSRIINVSLKSSRIMESSMAVGS